MTPCVMDEICKNIQKTKQGWKPVMNVSAEETAMLLYCDLFSHMALAIYWQTIGILLGKEKAVH